LNSHRDVSSPGPSDSHLVGRRTVLRLRNRVHRDAQLPKQVRVTASVAPAGALLIAVCKLLVGQSTEVSGGAGAVPDPASAADPVSRAQVAASVKPAARTPEHPCDWAPYLHSEHEHRLRAYP
jgi:hypothetical protein